MSILGNRFTLKIILSYVVLGSLAVLVSIYLYSEYKDYINLSSNDFEDKKMIETGTVINLVYETDSFSRLALLTQKEEDFTLYRAKYDSLSRKIEDIKRISADAFQSRQLDSVKELLELKNKNIEQLRILKITNSRDTSLDDILEEFDKLEISMGKNTIEMQIDNLEKLTTRKRQILQNYVDYLNSTNLNDTTTLKTKTVDSMLSASRDIVREAKKKNSRVRLSLLKKESELIKNDLTISAQLRRIISAFDEEVNKNINIEEQQRTSSKDRTALILKVAGVLGTLVILLFSYLILTDFFRAEKFKKNLEKEKKYSEDVLKSREQLISTVSHDLKTPINTITGYSELFASTSLSNKQEYYVKQIASSSNFVTKLVDDLLDFSKLEADKISLEFVPFSLDKLVTQVADSSNDMQRGKNIQLEVLIDSSIKNILFVSDPIRIRQILENLVSNAFKFTESGVIKIVAEETLRKGDKMEVVVKVSDTGIGISKDKQKLIFKEFTQAEANISQRFGGSGLGLTISRKLATLLEGELSVESEFGKGSSFMLKLPLKLSKRQEPILQQESTIRFSRIKVLLFDDDEAMLAMLQELFQQIGIDSEAYLNYNHWKQKKTEYDFILTDIQMPEINGFQVLQQVKRNSLGHYKNQPVVAMTGAREYDKEIYLKKGFSALLNKPFTKDELITTIVQLFPDRCEQKDTIREPSTDIGVALQKEICDLSMLYSFLESKESVESVLSEFYTQSESDIQRLKKVVDEMDFSEINAIAHKMGTMCKQLKAIRVIPILDNLEFSEEASFSEEKMKSLFLELSEEIRRLIKCLKERDSL